jgi:hypothetical protein
METTEDLSAQGYRYKAAERYERRRTDRGAHRSFNGGDGAAVSLQSKIRSPPGIFGRGAVEAARTVRVLNVGEQ